MAILEDQDSTDTPDPISMVEARTLFDGQRLDPPTFHERYAMMPDDFHAELINGVVYLRNMPIFEDHARSDSSIAWFLYSYRMETPGTIVQSNASTRIEPSSEVQPDCALRIDPEFGGQTSVHADRKYTIDAPELVVEIASITLRLDLTIKKQARSYAVGTKAATDGTRIEHGWEVERLADPCPGSTRSHSFLRV